MSDLQKWESALPDNFIACRDFHHAWKPVTAKKINTGYERHLICARCGVVKIQQLDNFGYLIRTKFGYVEGYQRPEGAGRMTKEDNARIRLMAFKPGRKRNA